jgi:hypothetical protein
MEPLLHAQRVSRDCVDFASRESKTGKRRGYFPHRRGLRLVDVGVGRCGIIIGADARPNLATTERHSMRRDVLRSPKTLQQRMSRDIWMDPGRASAPRNDH